MTRWRDQPLDLPTVTKWKRRGDLALAVWVGVSFALAGWSGVLCAAGSALIAVVLGVLDGEQERLS